MKGKSIYVKRMAPYIFGAWVFIGIFVLPIAQANSYSSADNEGQPRYVSGITPARARSLVGVGVGLVSIVIGWRYRLKHKTTQVKSKTWPKIGLGLAGVSIVLSVLHLATTTGEFGTGGGKAGAIVALVLGVIGASLNGYVLRLKEK